MTVTLTHPVRDAATLGTDAGKAAASWAFDGNTATHIYAAFLAGYEAGDPMVMDYYDPAGPLSGEWADGMTPGDLLRSVGIDPHDHDVALADDVCAEFEQRFADAYWTELQRVALIHTSGE
jgi:hypothetical protein